MTSQVSLLVDILAAGEGVSVPWLRKRLPAHLTTGAGYMLQGLQCVAHAANNIV